MKEIEKNTLCVLLQALADKNLIARDTCAKAKAKILSTLDGPDFFCHREERSHGHTQNSG